MTKKEWRKPGPDGSGLTKDQADFLFSIINKALDFIDPRDQHFVLLVLTREGVTDKDEDIVSTNVMSSMDREFAHDIMREWLHKETQ